MSNRRKLLLGLLALPIITGLIALASPSGGSQVAFFILGVPVLLLNMWEFLVPGGLGEEKRSTRMPRRSRDGSGNLLGNPILWVFIIGVAAVILFIIVYAGIRSSLTGELFTRELYTLMHSLGRRAWNFATTPVIFIAILVFVLALGLGSLFVGSAGGGQKKNLKEYSQIFHIPCVEPATAGLFRRKKDPWMGEWIDLKTTQLMVEIDGIDVTKPYLAAKVWALAIFSEGMPAEATPAEQEAFFHGVMEELCASVLPVFCTAETKEEGTVARFDLKAGVREKLLARLHGEKQEKPREEQEAAAGQAESL